MGPAVTGKAFETAVLLRGALAASTLDQGELARRTGITRPQINRYLQGRADPTVGQLRRILDALDARVTVVPAHTAAQLGVAQGLLDVLALVDALPRRTPKPTMTALPFTQLIEHQP